MDSSAMLQMGNGNLAGTVKTDVMGPAARVGPLQSCGEPGRIEHRDGGCLGQLEVQVGRGTIWLFMGEGARASLAWQRAGARAETLKSAFFPEKAKPGETIVGNWTVETRDVSHGARLAQRGRRGKEEKRESGREVSPEAIYVAHLEQCLESPEVGRRLHSSAKACSVQVRSQEGPALERGMDRTARVCSVPRRFSSNNLAVGW